MPHTEYKLSFEQRPEYLYVHVESEAVDQEMVIEYLHRVIDKSHQLSQSRVMVDREIPTTLTIGSQFFTGAEFVGMGISDRYIAFVDRHEENRANLEFAMMIANNRGAHLELFSNPAEAERWLLARF